MDILKLILEKDCQALNTKSYRNGRTPLHTSCLAGHMQVVKFILSLCPNTQNQTDSSGTTPIMDAVRGGHESIFDYLASQKPQSIHDKDILNRNCLHIACECGHSEIARLLINQWQMNPNDGLVTPLHWAAKQGHSGTIETLLELNANPRKSDGIGEGRIPLALAIGGQHIKATLVLMNHDVHMPFDVRLLSLAKSPDMKTCLEKFFKAKWNIMLYLPGTH